MRVFVVSAVRNAAKTLRSTYDHVTAFCGAHAVEEWIFVESDSEDATLKRLEILANQFPSVKVHTLGNLRKTYPDRVQRIAIARQYALDQLGGRPKADDVVLMIDADGVSKSLIPNDLERVLVLLEEFSVVTANSRGRYYDVLALRSDGWVTEDYRKTRDNLLKLGYSLASAQFESLVSRQVKISTNRAPIEVESAFGGFAIYRGAAITMSRYHVDGFVECEHVDFHKKLTELGHRICIDPKLRVTPGWRHSIMSSPLLRPAWFLMTALHPKVSNFLLSPFSRRCS